MEINSFQILFFELLHYSENKAFFPDSTGSKFEFVI